MKTKSWNPKDYIKEGATPEQAEILAKQASLMALETKKAKGQSKSWKSRSVWINKGYSEKEVDALLNFDTKRFNAAECDRIFGDRGNLIYSERQKNIQRQNRPSPFSQEFWVNKGCSIEQADFKRNSMRPIRKEYWQNKGLTEEDAIIKALEVKQSNNKKGAQGAAARSQKDIRKNNHRCVEYYIERGYSSDQAQQLLSEHQVWFSLDICIAKHGPFDGYQIWLDRQLKWQTTLTNKSESEIKKLNKKKNSIRLDLFENNDQAIEHYNNKRNMSLVNNISDLDGIVTEKVQNGFFHTTVEQFYDTQLPQIQKEILGLNMDVFKQRYQHLFYPLPSNMHTKSMWHRKTKKTVDGFLRSSFEIYFYDMFFKHKLDQLFNLSVDKRYPNSSFRFDFALTNKSDDTTIYVEVCPMILNPYYPQYASKMRKKQELFNCTLLATKHEIDAFVQEHT